jgi:S1-C subfamily serine protease
MRFLTAQTSQTGIKEQPTTFLTEARRYTATRRNIQGIFPDFSFLRASVLLRASVRGLLKKLLLFVCFSALWSAEDPALAGRQRLRQVAEAILPTYIFIGGGSGVVLPGNLLLTNHHVAGEQAKWKVTTASGSIIQARMLGCDPVGDLTLLQLASSASLPHVVLAGPEDAVVGREILAIGNPFALGGHDHEPTLTRGVIGGVRLARGNYADCIQIDAPVNPGNSGGPLLTPDGKLLGIIGQIRTRSGLRANTGIGLAIACTQIAEFLPLMMAAQGGYVHHADLPKGLVLIQTDKGAKVEKCPAEVPLAIGDLILSVDGRKTPSVEAVQGAFQARAYRAELRLSVLVDRDGTTLPVLCPVSRLAIEGRPWHGLTVRSGPKCLIISQVDSDSEAAKAKLIAGMQILMVDGRPVVTGLDLVKAMVGKEVGDFLTLELRDTAGKEQETRILLRPR